MSTHRSNNAVIVSLDATRRLDDALHKLEECIDKSSEVPIDEIDEEDSLVTSVSDLMESTRSHREERRVSRAKTSSGQE